MFSSLRTRFGIPGVISVIALVFAMFGGAYAASNDSGGKATSSAKAKKGPRGPKGATGPAGPQGPAGLKGDAGANGSNGAPGADGADGASVTNTAVATGVAGECNKLGGAKFTVGAGSPTFACNGKEGSPWAAGGTLPSKETETGAWAGRVTGAGAATASISFTLPVEEAPKAVFVPGEEAEGCPGVFEGIPTAEPGNLCVYAGEGGILGATFTGFLNPAEFPPGPTAAPTGVMVGMNCANSCLFYGTWAVTAK